MQISGGSSPLPRPSTQPLRTGDMQPTVVQNLVTTNRALVKQVKDDVVDVAHHPWQSFKHMLKGMVDPFLHPIDTVKHMGEGIKDDALGGAVDAVATASGVGFVGTVLLAGAAVVAAPLTGGASLAVAAAAFGAADVLGVICLGADGAGVALHEVRGALAKSEEEAASEGKVAASYAEDGALTLATYGVSALVEGAAVKLPDSLGRAMATVGDNTFGTLGVYDPLEPAARARAAVQNLSRPAMNAASKLDSVPLKGKERHLRSGSDVGTFTGPLNPPLDG